MIIVIHTSSDIFYVSCIPYKYSDTWLFEASKSIADAENVDLTYKVHEWFGEDFLSKCLKFSGTTSFKIEDVEAIEFRNSHLHKL